MIKLKAKRDCKYCLGAGLAVSLIGSQHVCGCILEGVEVTVYEKDYSIENRREYGLPKMVLGLAEAEDLSEVDIQFDRSPENLQQIGEGASATWAKTRP